jgi:hypothetical protein
MEASFDVEKLAEETTREVYKSISQLQPQSWKSTGEIQYLKSPPTQLNRKPSN